MEYGKINGKPMTREELSEILLQTLVTQGQDQSGIAMGRRSTDGSLYKSRTDEHHKRIMQLIDTYTQAKVEREALQWQETVQRAVIEARIDELDKANTLLQPSHMVNSGSDYTRMDAWFKDRLNILQAEKEKI